MKRLFLLVTLVVLFSSCNYHYEPFGNKHFYHFKWYSEGKISSEDPFIYVVNDSIEVRGINYTTNIWYTVFVNNKEYTELYYSKISGEYIKFRILEPHYIHHNLRSLLNTMEKDYIDSEIVWKEFRNGANKIEPFKF